ncbi:MAG: zinc-ribbon domain-containing protein [Clostridium sp.]|nr:zinc-ribbon domain-containing protein [Clostridium sp.]
MNICAKCGKEVKDNQKFCTSCGSDLTKPNAIKIEDEQKNSNDILTNKDSTFDDDYSNESTDKEEFNFDDENYNEDEDYNEDENYTTDRKPMNFHLTKKVKIIIGVVIFLIIASFAVVKVGNYLTDPNKLVTRFKNDVSSNNTSDLNNILYCNDSRLQLNNKSIDPLLSYFKNSPSSLDNVVQSLDNDAISPKDVNSLSASSSSTLTLVSVGKKFFFFPDYRLAVKPVFINIKTDFKDVNLSVNNTNVGKSDSDNFTKEYGPFVPGKYVVSANYKGKYITLNKTYPVNLVSDYKNTTDLTVLDGMNYVDISSEYPNAEIFVNGKDSGIKVQDASKFGPLDSSAKLYATYAKDGKTIKSAEYSCSSGDTSPYLSFEDSENDLNDVQNQLSELLQNYISNFTEAVNTNNVSLVTPYIVAGSTLDKEMQTYVPNTYNGGTTESNVSSNIVKYNISDDNNSGNIQTSEVYTITNKDGTSSNKSFNYTYSFTYDQNSCSYKFLNVGNTK